MAYDLDTHRFLHFNLTHDPAGDPDEDFHYLDIGKMLSEVNRKSFRQGMSYDVANVVFHDSDTSETFIKVCTAPNTWTVQAAWQAGFRHWRQQIDIAEKSLQDDDALTGPWSDFKVYINEDHRTDPDKAVFVDCEDNTLTSGDWDYSQYTTATDSGASYDNVYIALMGPHNGDFTAGSGTLVSLLEVLENTINTPQEDPDIAAGAVDNLWAFLNPEMGSHPDMVQQVISRGETENDLPPYASTTIAGAGAPASGRPSEPWIIRECCVPGGGSHMASVGGFTAPCGLVVFETMQASEEDKIGVTLELAPGNYKGVSARPMRGGGF